MSASPGCARNSRAEVGFGRARFPDGGSGGILMPEPTRPVPGLSFDPGESHVR